MCFQFDFIENVIEIDEACTVEDAETLLQLVLEHDDAMIDASKCTHIHTAAMQVLLAAKPKFRDLPEDEFIRQFLAPYWDTATA